MASLGRGRGERMEQVGLVGQTKDFRNDLREIGIHGALQENERIGLLSGSCVGDTLQGRETPRQLREPPSVMGAVEIERSD